MSIRNDIVVRDMSNSILKNAWAGGLDLAQVSKIDLNGDNKEDLFIFDRADNSISTFLYSGNANSFEYSYAPEYIDSFPDTLQSWVLLVDYNNDGYKDIWTGTDDSRIRVYKNTMGQTGKLGFSLAVNKILSKYFPTLTLELYSSRIDVPGIIDVDNDGDLDFLTWDVLGGIIEFHKNVAVDSGWGLDTLPFLMQSSCFGHFHEGGTSCQAFLNDAPCGAGQINPNDIDDFRLKYEQADILGTRAHSGSTILALDLNADQKKDLIIGDVSCNDVYALNNAGTMQIADFDTAYLHFPQYDTPVNIPIFVATFYADINGDGKRDLIAAPNVTGGNENQTGVWYYKNTNTDASPVFNFQQEAFLQDQMIELGGNSTPTLFDFNHDGLMDMVIGNYGVYDSGAATPKTTLFLYQNMGTASKPEFKLVNPDMAGLGLNPNFALLEYVTPTMGDLDGDGDMDMLFGERFGKIYHYENTAPSGSNAVFTYVTDNYQGIDVGDHSAPHLYDLDGDLDLDLLVGNKSGLIKYFENQGTAQSANFVLMDDTLGGINIDNYPGQTFSDGYAKPFVIDYDQDSIDELLVGTQMGQVFIYEDLTSNPNVNFTYVGDLFDWDFGGFSAPCGAIIENNTQPTYIVGNARGGVNMLGETPLLGIQNGPKVASNQIKLFPNPANERVLVEYNRQTGKGRPEAFLSNLLGQVLMHSDFQGNTAAFELKDLQPGIYLVTVKDDGQVLTDKLIVH